MLPSKGKKSGMGVTIAFLGGKGESPDAYKDDAKAAPDEEETDNEEGESDPASATRRSALKQFVSALGGNPADVDMAKAESALCAFFEAAHGEEEAPSKPVAAKKSTLFGR